MIKHLLKFLSSTVGTLGLASCVSTVDFSEGRTYQGVAAPSVQVFFDKHGDIYPAAWIPSDDTLTGNFDRSLSCRYDLLLCNASSSDIYSDPPSARLYETWRKKQRLETSRLAEEVIEKLNSTNTKKIVILIHGYRVSKAGKSYDDAKKVLLEGRPARQSPVFLEVHWDGRDSPTLPLSALRAWPFAQKTAPAVGFRLRPLLNELRRRLDEDKTNADLYVLTHSTGAVVAGALFGNPSEALPCLDSEKAANKCGPAYTEFYDSARSESAPETVPQWRDMGLVMLAAATPAATFAVPGAQDLGFLGPSDAKLMLSLSSRDSALNKYFGVPNFLGYSGLGARQDDLQVLQDTLQDPNSARAHVTILDMTEELGRNHMFQSYMETKEFSKARDLLWKR